MKLKLPLKKGGTESLKFDLMFAVTKVILSRHLTQQKTHTEKNAKKPPIFMVSGFSE